MAMSRRLAPGVALFLGVALAGCESPERTDEQETATTKRSALSATLFQPYVSYPTGSAPQAVAIGDLDGDGRKDVALLTSYAGDAANDYMVHVFLQDAVGALKPRVKYPVGGQTSSIDVGDVNGDGRADVVVGGVGLGVLLQNATGTLDPMVTYPTANARQVKIGDFNGDGRMDVAGISSGGNGLAVFLQMDTGTLGSPVAYVVPHGGFDELDAGDIDGDGRTDLVVMSGQLYAMPDVSVVLQTSAGTLGAPTTYSLSGNLNTTGVAIGDTNDDGRTDILVTYGGNSPFSFIGRFLQNSEGTLDPAVSTPSYEIPAAVVLADVDGDNRKDVIVNHAGWNRLGVYRQFPGGELLAEELYTIGYTSYQTQALAIGDISGDGRPDALIADSKGLGVLRHVNDNTLTMVVTVPPGGPFYVGVPLTVRWAVGDAVTLAGFDLSFSTNNGASYTPIAECTGLPGTARECTWTPSGPGTTRVRVTAREGSGPPASGEATCSIVRPSIGVTSPRSNVFAGTTTNITWFHNLPPGNVSFLIELSRDGGATYETLADAAPNTGSFPWNVTGPTDNARVRVTSVGSLPASASSPAFAILAPTLTVTAPTSGDTVYTPALSVAWTHNVGAAATTVRIELSRDGGATFETIAASAPNSGSFSGSVSGPGSTAALIRVTTNGAVTATGTSAPFTLVQPSAAVTSPAPGAILYVGAPALITWSSTLPASSLVTVELSRDGGGTYAVLATGAPNTGSLGWVVSGPETGVAVVRVSVSGPGSPSATSGPFAIAVPSLAVTGPAAGAAFYTGTPLAITWATNLSAGSPVLVELSRDGGTTFETLAAAAPNTGSFIGVATGPDSAAVVARVTVSDTVALSSTSGAFSIATPSLTVTGPVGGTLAWAGTPVTITWTHNLSDVDPVSIELSRDGGATFEVLAAGAPNTGSFVWTASGPDAAEARVRVTSLGAVSASGVGPAFQILDATLAVTSPTAGASWAIGTVRAISWTSNLPAGTTVGVALSRDGGATWTFLASAAPASGSLAWTATGPATTAAIVRVTANGGVPAVATSGTFAIGNPAVAVTSPAAGVSWTIGTARTITWTSNLLPSATVKIQLSRNGGSTYSNLNTTAPNTGSFTWTVTGGATTTAIVKVTANGTTASALSGTFTIAAASVTVNAPNTAVTWTIGTVQSITWGHNVGAGAQFTIEVSRSGTWSVIDSAVTAAGATSGSYSWTVTGPKTTNAKVRVTWNGGTAKDTSDVAFKIN